MTERSLLDKLMSTYKAGVIKPDVFGRRPALPSEIEHLVGSRETQFPQDLEQYLPTEQDVYLKENVLNRRRQSRKPR